MGLCAFCPIIYSFLIKWETSAIELHFHKCTSANWNQLDSLWTYQIKRKSTLLNAQINNELNMKLILFNGRGGSSAFPSFSIMINGNYVLYTLWFSSLCRNENIKRNATEYQYSSSTRPHSTYCGMPSVRCHQKKVNWMRYMIYVCLLHRFPWCFILACTRDLFWRRNN